MQEMMFICNPNEEIIVSSKSRETKPKINQPFSCISRQGLYRGKLMGIPLTELYMDFNKEEQWFYKMIWKALNFKTNQAVIEQSKLTKHESNKLSSAYQSLKQKDLVKRVCKETYMINPNAVIYPDTQTENIKLWDSL